MLRHCPTFQACMLMMILDHFDNDMPSDLHHPRRPDSKDPLLRNKTHCAYLLELRKRWICGLHWKMSLTSKGEHFKLRILKDLFAARLDFWIYPICKTPLRIPLQDRWQMMTEENCEGGAMTMLSVPTPVSTRGQLRMRVQSGVPRHCNDLTILMNSW